MGVGDEAGIIFGTRSGLMIEGVGFDEPVRKTTASEEGFGEMGTSREGAMINN